MGGRQTTEDKPLKKHFLMKIYKDTVLVLSNMELTIIFTIHES